MKKQKAKKLLNEWQYGDSLDSLLLAYKSIFKTDLKKRLDSIDDSTAKDESFMDSENLKTLKTY